MRQLLDAMTDVPAFVQNGRLDDLAANTLGRALYLDLFDDVDPGGIGRVPNHARCTFLDHHAADFYLTGSTSPATAWRFCAPRPAATPTTGRSPSSLES